MTPPPHSIFVNHVLELYKEIDEIIQIPFQHIQNLDRRSGNAQAIQTTGRENNEDDIVELESPANEIENNNTATIPTTQTEEDSDTDPELATMIVDNTGTSYSFSFFNKL